MTSRVLILGGTTEGRLLATACAALPGVETVSSLAGRTTDPLIPAGELRIGGFGGPDGLAAYLKDERIDAVVDATHTFARQMTANAVAAARAVGVPLLILNRPGWTAQDGDEWHRVASLAEAAAVLPQLGRRIFLTTGRQGIGAFAHLRDLWFLARSVEPPAPPMPAAMEVVLDRGPFTEEGERSLLTTRRIDVLVTKDSGGPAPKLAAARAVRIPVVLIDRPPLPDAPVATTVDEAVRWLTR